MRSSASATLDDAGEGETQNVKVLAGHLDADGSLRITEVQPEGKRPMAYEDWLRGTPVDLRGGLS